MNWFEQWAINKIMEPMENVLKIFTASTWIAKVCEKIGIGELASSVIIGLGTAIYAAVILVLPTLIFTWIIKLIANFFKR